MTSLHDLPFEWGWRGMELGPARPCQYTYGFFSYESLPPLPELDGTLAWLGPIEGDAVGAPADRRTIAARERLTHIEREAVELSLALPPAFVRFMGSPVLQDRIPDYAGLWVPHLKRIVPCVANIPGWLISFLCDQQDVVEWFLYLTPSGEELVIGSYEGGINPTEWDERNDGVKPTEKQLAEIIENAKICAASFEAFMYRFWLESSIYFELYNSFHAIGGTLLASEGRRYLAHYEANPDLSNT